MLNNWIKKTIICAMSIVCCACQNNNLRPAIVPGVEIRTSKPKLVPQKPQTEPVSRKLKVIGAVEPIYFLPMKTPFISRIDTGAETSSIDVANRRIFERDGEKWVAFDMINRQNGEQHHFEKRIKRQPKVKRLNGSEERIVVMMNVKMGGEIVSAQFSLAERERFNYQGLIGRNILTGRAIVDTSIANTLR